MGSLEIDSGFSSCVIAKAPPPTHLRYGGKEGLAPAAYMRRYHGPASEATAPTQMVFSVKDAIQSSTGAPPLSPSSPKSPETKSKQQFQSSWHAQPANNKWKDERTCRRGVGLRGG